MLEENLHFFKFRLRTSVLVVNALRGKTASVPLLHRPQESLEKRFKTKGRIRFSHVEKGKILS